MSFHDEIKMSTDLAHGQAEGAPFISSLMGGELSQAAYLDYLKAFLPIYSRMEEILQGRTQNPLLTYFNHRALDRTELLTHDIAVLDSDFASSFDWTELNSVREYLARLEGDISDARLLAHHYIRYLGDLSGGQVISKLVSRHYAVAPEALTFYDFNQIGDLVFYKKRYRDLLNLIPLTDDEKFQFLDEVTHLYRLSREIFIELGNTHLASSK